MSRIASIFIFIAAFCASPLITTAQQNKTGYQELATEVLRYVNEYRTGLGLGKLKMNDVISLAGEKHSANMASRKVPFGHAGFDERMAKLRKQLNPVNAWAENVAYSQNDAKQVVDMWLHSPGHRKNIEGDYNITGIGIARDKDDNYYYTQIFMKKE